MLPSALTIAATIAGDHINRTYGKNKNLYIYPFLLTRFGPIYCTVKLSSVRLSLLHSLHSAQDVPNPQQVVFAAMRAGLNANHCYLGYDLRLSRSMRCQFFPVPYTVVPAYYQVPGV